MVGWDPEEEGIISVFSLALVSSSYRQYGFLRNIDDWLKLAGTYEEQSN